MPNVILCQPDPEPQLPDHLDTISKRDGCEVSVAEWAAAVERTRKNWFRHQWQNDSDFRRVPERYKLFDHKPTLSELMDDLKVPHLQTGAFEALKIFAPDETTDWLQHAFHFDRHGLRRAHDASSEKIAENFRRLAADWKLQIVAEQEKARRKALKPLKRRSKKKKEYTTQADDELEQ